MQWFSPKKQLTGHLTGHLASPYTFAYRHAYGSQADGHKSLDNSAKETLQEFGLQFWLSTNSESRSEYWGFARRRSLSAIPRVAPRTPWISQSCSENGLFTFHFFQNWGSSQVSDKRSRSNCKVGCRRAQRRAKERQNP